MIFTFFCMSRLIFNILLCLKFIQIKNDIKKSYICKYENHCNTIAFFNDFNHIGSPTFASQNLLFRYVVLENYVMVQTKNLHFSCVLQ